MPLVLHNTLTRRKEDFRPLDPSRVRLYVCGPTVYSFAHIGNARPVIVFDLLFRLLRRLYGEDHVVYARNITDVDDKIIEAARANGETIRDLTERTQCVFEADMAALNTLPPTIEPRATEHIAPMVRMIETLIAGGHAYAAEGHVLFAVESMAEYGRLSGRSLDELLAGARVEVAPYKRHPGDFVLWKPSTEAQPGWDSPWGRGRPGWHIECSAMSEAHLGEHFDIHGGGIDLIFPHHENELAQSVCAHGGRPFVNIWMHNAFLDLEGEKMSKSLGNIRTVHALLDEAPGEALRWAMLTAHYRDPLDWTEDRLRQAKAALDRFYGALRSVAEIEAIEPVTPAVLPALEDDLNTPLAQSVLHELVSTLNKAETVRQKAEAKGALLAAGRLMGFLQQDPGTWLRWRPKSAEGLSDDEVDALIAARRQARADKNFGEADRLRKQLTDGGIILEDKPDVTIWRRGGL
ncbi:MAG: cysteine--tRNA ligase [Aliidongia sp.]